MKPIETYKCLDCENEMMFWKYATFEKPSCNKCGEHLNVVETTDWHKGE